MLKTHTNGLWVSCFSCSCRRLCRSSAGLAFSETTWQFLDVFSCPGKFCIDKTSTVSEHRPNGSVSHRASGLKLSDGKATDIALSKNVRIHWNFQSHGFTKLATTMLYTYMYDHTYIHMILLIFERGWYFDVLWWSLFREFHILRCNGIVERSRKALEDLGGMNIYWTWRKHQQPWHPHWMEEHLFFCHVHLHGLKMNWNELDVGFSPSKTTNLCHTKNGGVWPFRLGG